MTNEELKKKIKEILRKRMTELLGSCHTDEISLTEEGAEAILFYADEFADALITAGIGDVSELKKHRVIVEQSPVPTDDNCYILPNTSPIIKQLYSGKEVEQISKERDEYKHRAEVAERALESACQDIISTMEFICEAGGVVTVENYSPEKETPQAYLKRAERELAEERKDEQS